MILYIVLGFLIGAAAMAIGSAIGHGKKKTCPRTFWTCPATWLGIPAVGIMGAVAGAMIYINIRPH